jgi:SAM-dependent methyltransferase
MKLGWKLETNDDHALMDNGSFWEPFMVEIQLAPLFARTLHSSAAAGVFESLRDGGKSVAEISASSGVALRACEALIEALSSTDYVKRVGERYELTELGARWFTGSGQGGLVDFVAGGAVAMECATHLPAFVATDESISMLETMTPERWRAHELAQRALAITQESSLVEHVPVPKEARRMLDIGAAHGHRAVALCRRHPALSAVVFDLPEAVTAAAPLLASAGMSGRIEHRAGDVAAADFGTDAYDVILYSRSVARPTLAERTALTRRLANALRPGGVLVFDDFLPPANAEEGGQESALEALFLAMTGEAEPCTLDDATRMQRGTGLDVLPPITVRGPMSTLLMGRKVAETESR